MPLPAAVQAKVLAVDMVEMLTAIPNWGKQSESFRFP